MRDDGAGPGFRNIRIPHTSPCRRAFQQVPGPARYVCIYGAASPPRRRPPPPPWYAPPPHPKPRLSFQQTVTRHPRNCPPKLGLAPWQTRGSGSTWNHKTGNHRGGVGKHNTGNHRAPSPSRPLRHTDDNDGDDVVVLYLVDIETRAWLVMFLRKLYRPFVTPS